MRNYTASREGGERHYVLVDQGRMMMAERGASIGDGLYVIHSGETTIAICRVTNGAPGPVINLVETIPLPPLGDNATLEELLGAVENAVNLLDGKGARCPHCPALHKLHDFCVSGGGLISAVRSAVAKLRSEDKEAELSALADGGNETAASQLARLRKLFAWRSFGPHHNEQPDAAPQL